MGVILLHIYSHFCLFRFDVCYVFERRLAARITEERVEMMFKLSYRPFVKKQVITTRLELDKNSIHLHLGYYGQDTSTSKFSDHHNEYEYFIVNKLCME